jgi:hypothetical protein
VWPCVLSLPELLFTGLARAARALGCGGSAGRPLWVERKRDWWTRRRLHSAMQRLMYQNKYSRATMVVNVGMMYACIAPLNLLPLLLWLAIVVPQWLFQRESNSQSPDPALAC